MSNSDLESLQSHQEAYESYCVPRKFIFDIPDDNTKQQREASEETKALKRSLEAERHMPFVFSFPEPKNYKESYSQLVKHILSVYNHIRLLVVEEYFNELKHITREFKVEQPSDCVTVLKEILNGCCEKLQMSEGRADENINSVNDYEELLQKAEAKIRIFIRNEQIFRLNFDILTQKCEDAEKYQFEVQQEIEAFKKTQESLTKENHSLLRKLSQKDDEIRKLNKELDSLQKNFKEVSANLSSYENIDNSTIIHEHRTGGAQTWNQQLLHTLLNENKFTPTETSTRGAGFDLKSQWARNKMNSSNGFPPTDKSRNERKSTTPVNVSLLNTSANNLKKGKSDKLTNSILSEYKKKLASNRDLLNASLDIVLNKSTEVSQERQTHTGNAHSQMKSSNGLKSGFSQEKMRVKPPVKERKLESSIEKKLPLHLLNKSTGMQKTVAGTKYSNASTRPSSTGKSRGSPLVQRNRVVQTEHSPEPNEKSQESGIFYTYASNYGIDKYSGTYAGLNRKKQAETSNRENNRDNRSSSKGKDKSSMMIQKMIAEQLNKKLVGKKTL